ncbi:hypothetical protein A1O3_04042 [Capronia epimyces CBS 606.96]|uniref:Uncharacterized protein n=1 Tax=Capronia epimyces CBS 606.96 TaxID=1182542 RepID=W9YXR1_9EURO|nr:uncharacterized protein A1O3_04042 [Capronia epimyces CBS 606.96]EXJ87084.1 hypothetical protein A1O3_04042 [Capronia epimyces CBS 606.96]
MLYRIGADSPTRYAGLLLQHHAALTAGLIELYSRLINGQSWEGSPVDELNGSPSVHCILERLGVIDTEDEIDPTSDLAGESDSISFSCAKAREPPAKVQKLAKSTARNGSVSDRQSRSSRSPLSTSTTIAPAPPSQPSTGYLNQVASPSSSGSRSGSIQSTMSSWESQSPGLSDDYMFTTPVPTPATTSESQCPDYQMPMQAYPPFSDGTVPNYSRESIPTPVPAPVPFISPETVTDPCTAGYFMDAAGGMGLYGWEDGSAGGNIGFGSMPPEGGAWDQGVFV